MPTMDPRVWTEKRAAENTLVYFEYAYPVVLVVFFLATFLAHSVRSAPKEEPEVREDKLGPGGRPLPRSKKKSQPRVVDDFGPRQKALFNWLSVALICSFAGDAVLTIVQVIVKRKENWWCGQHVAIYVIASFFVYGLMLISLIDTKPSPTIVHGLTWSLGLAMGTVILGAKFSIYSTDHKEPSSTDPKGGQWKKSMTQWEAVEAAIDVIRILLLLSLLFFFGLFTYLGRSSNHHHFRESSIEENTRLLNGHSVENGHANRHAYGSINSSEPAPWSRPDKMPARGWWEYVRGYTFFLPYLWPSKSRRLQLTFVVCFVLVCLARVVNILVPHQVGIVTNELAGENGKPPNIPWLDIALYILFRLLQGNNGLLGALRGALWIPISQYSYQELSTASFEHVHSLSLDFHLGKKTGEVLSALSKGNSINTFLEQATFQMLPMLIDLIFAVAYFLYEFDAYYALVITIITFVYLYLTVRMAQWRADARREMANLSRAEDAVKNDSMVSYETVKYFNAEQYEFQRYRDAVQKFQGQELLVLISLNIMNVTQNGVFTFGLMISCFIAAYQISQGTRKVGEFATLVMYMAQLQAPLNFFGTFYRSIQYAMINAERMLELFREHPTVVDEPAARELPSCEGEIRFSEVSFAYDPRKPALDGVTFCCAPGTTTAFVGESGGGKSTTFRLLYRFYNCQEGSIQIDGHDVQDVTIDSLRRHIGVVPQDTVLFNESIMYNLKYANQEATDEDVFNACRAASIHERILSFPDGYDSRVGERGLKLSGGEKQRVAIARTILKNPRIILLDEATAALDTETEGNIQEALRQLSWGRTTLVIAHRLSTITNADQIVVLHAGKVVECGNHAELLELNGRYASMWRRQIKAQRAAEQAKALTDRADRLRSEGQGSDSSVASDDERPPSRPFPASGATTPGPREGGYELHAHGSQLPPGHP